MSFFPALGDTPNVVMKAKAALESLGHTLIPFKLPEDWNVVRVAFELYFADQCRFLRSAFQHEPIAENLVLLDAFARSSSIWKRWNSFFTRFGSKRAALFARGGLNTQKSEDLWDRMDERREIIQELLKKMENLQVDLILGPVWPIPAVESEYLERLLRT